MKVYEKKKNPTSRLWVKGRKKQKRQPGGLRPAVVEANKVQIYPM